PPCSPSCSAMAEAASPARATAAPQPVGFKEPYRVLETEQRTATITELWLRPLAMPLDDLPGEYALLEDRDRVIPPRSCSLANAPRPDGLISLLITRVPDGEASGWLRDRLRAGVERASQRRRG